MYYIHPCFHARLSPSVCTVHSLREGIEAVGLLGVREGHSHARGERGVQDDCGALIASGQVHRGHGANALAIHNHILWTYAIPGRKTQNKSQLDSRS